MELPVEGSYTALPTPFRSGRVDLDAFEELIDAQVAAGSDGIVVCGTTGETSTLSEYERRSVVHAAVDFARGRLQVMAGVGTSCTRTTVELTRFAVSCGVDSVLVVTPYYNRPSPRGLLLHYSAIAEASAVPLVLYNVPSRTGLDLEPPLVAELARRHASIVGIKEATDRVERVQALREAADIAVLCGEDGCLPEFLAAGAVGTISVVGNLLPAEVAELVRAARRSDAPTVASLWGRIEPLARALFVETNPVPLKAALALLGRCEADVRSPLAPLEPRSRRTVEEALRAARLMSAALTV